MWAAQFYPCVDTTKIGSTPHRNDGSVYVVRLYYVIQEFADKCIELMMKNGGDGYEGAIRLQFWMGEDA